MALDMSSGLQTDRLHGVSLGGRQAANVLYGAPAARELIAPHSLTPWRVHIHWGLDALKSPS